MQFGETVWVIYDTGWKAIRESGDNSLPLIFETKEEADEVAEGVSFFEVKECILLPKNDTKLSNDDMKIFLEMLLDPPEPNDVLKKAATLYKKLAKPDETSK